MTDITPHRDERDPWLPGRLLATECDALVPLLRSRPDADFALPVPACPGWTVRDVLAHGSAALARVLENRFEEGVFSAESNDRDIAERAGWSHARVVDELEHGMRKAGPVIAGGDPWLDLLALAEWVHAGDVRDAWREPGAYAGAGLPDALTLLVRLTRERDHVPLRADLAGAEGPLRLGEAAADRAPARYAGDAATLVRLYAGRPLTGASYELTGVTEAELNVFG
ncbi:maleylpyruvate isomerase family mycothiol-dependent enzyme [Streptomyces sp. NPDC017248]|uniref:maleylpyruvate isomerase family mycothiol-dependent enzyme n=1 Tax=unclassified Streptomyces TaxID=2593676 RepID=UPI003790F11A